MLMAAQSSEAEACLHTDCLTVQQGAQRSPEWANDPRRKFARIWNPLLSSLDCHGDRVVWMPAHCTENDVGVKQLSNGSLMSYLDLGVNAIVDSWAKEAASQDRVPDAVKKVVRQTTAKVRAVARTSYSSFHQGTV